MKIGLAVTLASVAVVAGGCAATPPPPERPRTVALENAGFEAAAEVVRNCAPRWGCSMHADPGAFRFVVDATTASEGRQSLRIEPVTKEPWAVASQVIRDTGLRGARLRLSLAIRLEGVAGAGAGPFFVAQDGVGRTIHHKQDLALGTRDWERRSLEFVMPEGMFLFEVGAILEGSGRVWIDDVRLEVLDVGSAGKKPV